MDQCEDHYQSVVHRERSPCQRRRCRERARESRQPDGRQGTGQGTDRGGQGCHQILAPHSSRGMDDECGSSWCRTARAVPTPPSTSTAMASRVAANSVLRLVPLPSGLWTTTPWSALVTRSVVQWRSMSRHLRPCGVSPPGLGRGRSLSRWQVPGRPPPAGREVVPVAESRLGKVLAKPWSSQPRNCPLAAGPELGRLRVTPAM